MATTSPSKKMRTGPVDFAMNRVTTVVAPSTTGLGRNSRRDPGGATYPHVRSGRVGRDQLTLHADRGPSMTSKPVALLLADLAVTKTYSRPHVSNDDPYSESQFKTLKYRPDFPERVGSIEDARAHCTDFFRWYNTEHRHSSLGLHTPHDVHFGLAAERRAQQALVLAAAYAATPNRVVNRPPTPALLPTAAWINPPKLLRSEDAAQ